MKRFACLVGKYTDLIVFLVQESDVSFAVTTHHGVASDADDPLLLPRIRMKEKTKLAAVLP